MDISRHRLIQTSLIAPLIIACLVYKPSSGTSLALSRMACDFFAIISVGSILIKSIKAVYSKIKKENYPLILFLRPSVAAIAGIAGIIYLESINKIAKAYLDQTAAKIQAVCIAQNKCPDLPEGWLKNHTTYLVGNTEFSVSYNLNKERNSFFTAINYVLDTRYVVSGGIGSKELVRRNYH